MSSQKSWIIALVVALFVVGVGVFLMSPWFFPGSGAYARGGWGMWGCPMCGMGWWGGGAWGVFGLLVMVLVPIVFLLLLILGVAWIARSLIQPSNTAWGLTCPSCGRPVQPDWTVCPYCGTPLRTTTPRAEEIGT